MFCLLLHVKPCWGQPFKRNVTTSGYSSFTDSQFFFGSQFWPENSQGTSQDMSLSSMNSQQSSEVRLHVTHVEFVICGVCNISGPGQTQLVYFHYH